MLQRSTVIISLLAGLFVGATVSAQLQEREVRQFELNAKLAGRTLACGDRAGHASLRAASRRLAALLPDNPPLQQSMQAFDKRARLQRRFTERASNKHHACDRINEQLQENLRYTQLIAPAIMEPKETPRVQ